MFLVASEAVRSDIQPCWFQLIRGRSFSFSFVAHHQWEVELLGPFLDE